MTQKSLFQQLADGISNAVSDIREKLVEESFFGRSLSDKASEHGMSWEEATAPRSFGSSIHEKELSRERATQAHDDHDLSR